MASSFRLTIDGVEITAWPGHTILEAAQDAGIYIPRLCYQSGLSPHGSCRVCTVKANGRFVAACTTPADVGMTILNESDPELRDYRRAVVEMLFVEGNHICPICEKSGNCELQAIAYRLGILTPRFPFIFPQREIDATHPDILLDRNRCIQCGRCVRASQNVDGKHVFELVNRGIDTSLGVDSTEGLGCTGLSLDDKAADICPVGAINRRGTAFRVPIGKRIFDLHPIGSEIEAKSHRK